MAKTVSFSVGRVAILHDVRKAISANIDKALMQKNEIIIDKLKDYEYNVEAYTNAKFQPYIDEYNLTQNREERKKNIPYTEIIAEENKKLIEKAENNKLKGIKRSVRKPTKLCHEYVFQIGDRETNGTLSADLEKNKKYAREVIQELQKKYPHIDILLATFHADEPNGSLHTHILVQFTGEGYKQGLSHQISMSKALELDGFERSQNRGDYAINRWCQDIKDTIMTDKLREIFEEEVVDVGEHRKHEDIVFFREKAKKEEQALQDIRKEYNELFFELDSLKGDILMTMDDLNMLDAQDAVKTAEIEKLDKNIYEAKKELETANMRLQAIENRLQDAITACQATEYKTAEIMRDQQNIIALRNEMVEIMNRTSRDLGIRFKQITDGYIIDVQRNITELARKHNNQYEQVKNKKKDYGDR